MQQQLIKGILKKNSTGRAYLVFQQEPGQVRILNLKGNTDLLPENGRAVQVEGKLINKRFYLRNVQPINFPRRTEKKAA